jgi:hypothetical protein
LASELSGCDRVASSAALGGVPRWVLAPLKITSKRAAFAGLFLCAWLGCSVYKANEVLRKIVAQTACEPSELAAAVMFVATNVALTLWLTGAQQWRALLLLPPAEAPATSLHAAFSVAITDSLVRCCGVVPKVLIAAATRKPACSGGAGRARRASGANAAARELQESSEAGPSDGGVEGCVSGSSTGGDGGSSTSSGGTAAATVAPAGSWALRFLTCGAALFRRSGRAADPAAAAVPRRSSSGARLAVPPPLPAPAQPQAPHAAVAHVSARRRARLLALYDYIQASVRVVLPAPVWCSYLMTSTRNPTLCTLLVAAYLAFKAHGLFRRGQLLLLATRLVLRTGALYGRYLKRAEIGVGADAPVCPICQDPCAAPIRLDCSHVFCEVRPVARVSPWAEGRRRAGGRARRAGCGQAE